MRLNKSTTKMRPSPFTREKLLRIKLSTQLWRNLSTSRKSLADNTKDNTTDTTKLDLLSEKIDSIDHIKQICGNDWEKFEDYFENKESQFNAEVESQYLPKMLEYLHSQREFIGASTEEWVNVPEYPPERVPGTEVPSDDIACSSGPQTSGSSESSRLPEASGSSERFKQDTSEVQKTVFDSWEPFDGGE